MILSAVKAINWSFVLHEFLGGMLMYLWLGRMRLHRWACVAAVMFAFCAPFFLRIYAGHLTPNNVIAWMPLVFLAIDGIIAAPSLGWCLVGTAAVSMEILAGYPQIGLLHGHRRGVFTRSRGFTSRRGFGTVFWDSRR